MQLSQWEEWTYESFRPLLFCQDPEMIHERMLWLLEKTSLIPGVLSGLEKLFQWDTPLLNISVLGKTFPNPIGIAAGFDKNGKVFNPLFAFGFGFVEIGTITPLSQPGNPKPRIFRLPEDSGLINRLGFNNHGIEAMIQQLRQQPPHGILGINIGKNKITPLEKANDDYALAFQKLYDWAGYIVINVSSPNTEGLRALQEANALKSLLERLLNIRRTLIDQGIPSKPILLKIAPDLTDDGFRDIVKILHEFKIDGVIATNTTIRRDGLKNQVHSGESGGLSGTPLKDTSTQIIGKLYQELPKHLVIIGVGGIFTGKDAYVKIRAGASLVQIYTGLIYRGPGIAKLIQKELLQLLKQDGFTSVTEAIGADFR